MGPVRIFNVGSIYPRFRWSDTVSRDAVLQYPGIQYGYSTHGSNYPESPEMARHDVLRTSFPRIGFSNFSDFFFKKTSNWIQIKLPTIYITVWRMRARIYLLSDSETLGKKTNSTPLEKGGRAPVSQRNDQAPCGVDISVVKTSKTLRRSDAAASPSSLSRSIPIGMHFLDNKFRRANSGSLPIAEKGRDAGTPFLV